MPATEPQRSLVRKLAEVLAAAGNVAKKGKNKSQNYDFARESDVVDLIRPLLAARQVILTISITNHERVDLYKTSSGNSMVLTIVTGEGTWHDGESGEELSAGSWVGYGADSGDKGVYKALTGLEKYLLMKSFLIGTGDDPEGDEKVDRAEAALGASARGGARVSASSQPGVQRGGRSGIATQAQVQAIGSSAKQLGLKAGDLSAFVAKTLGVEPPTEGPKLVAFIGELTAGQAGKLVSGLRDLQRPAGATEPGAEQTEEEMLADALAATAEDDEPGDGLGDLAGF